MSVREFVRSISERYLVVLGILVVSLAIGFTVLATQEPNYRASTTLSVAVQLPSEANAEALAQASKYANYRTITFEALVVAEPILNSVIGQLGLNATPAQLSDHVTSLSAIDTNIIEVRVLWPDAAGSAEIANAIAAEAVSTLSTSGSAIDVRLEQLQRAEAATAPVVPNPPMTLGLATFAGLLISTIFIVWRHSRRHRPSDAED